MANIVASVEAGSAVTVSLDRAPSGVGLQNITAVIIDGDYYLNFTYTNGFEQLVTLPLVEYAQSDAVVYKPAGTGAVDTNVQTKLRQYVSVKDSGAVGDGVTDDTAAINLAFDYLRTLQGADASDGRNSVSILFPRGKYAVSSVNATNIRSYGWSVEARGAELIATTAGKVVFDLLNSRFGTINNLVIRGGSTNTPRVGFQIGYRVANVSAGNLAFHGCYTVGNFTLAGFINFGSEETSTYDCRFSNESTTATSYCLVHDSCNYWGVTSDYAVITLPPLTSYSFVQVQHYNLACIKVFGGPAAWLGWHSDRHSFHKSYMAVIDNFAIDLVFDPVNSPGLSHQMLYLDIGFETTGIKTAVRFNRITDGSTVMGNFVFKDHGPFTTEQVFSSTSNTGTVRLVGMEIDISRFGSTTPTNGLFNDPDKFIGASGVIKTRTASNITGLPTNFKGSIFCVDADDIAYPVGTIDVKSYSLDVTVPEYAVIKGEQRYYGDTTAVAPGGLKSLSYTSIDGYRVSTNNIYNNQANISDDTAVSFDMPFSGFTGLVFMSTALTSGPQGLYWVRSSAIAPAIQPLTTLGASVATGTGVLTGTTGVDGKFTVHAASDGKLYLENRLGTAAIVRLQFMCGI